MRHEFLDVPSTSSTEWLSLGHYKKSADLFEPDPRVSSTQSLAPSSTYNSSNELRRRLLIVYIHGFIGNDNSFQSFPVHVHRYLRTQLTATHVVHSKIYPRYKTYKAFHLARDNFSRWLSAHERPDTDVVLVGHSMGGLVAADVVLMRENQQDGSCAPRHRILGTVNLDVPFVGVDNGVILTGILSPFRSKPTRPENDDALTLSSSRISGMSTPALSIHPSESSSVYHQPSMSSSILSLKSRSTIDPHFNPHYPNDIRIQDRGWWQNVMHFAEKHKPEGLMNATIRHFRDHFEFGSCLLDSRRLNQRYRALRNLDHSKGTDNIDNRPATQPRTRFVQYYTVCYKNGNSHPDSFQDGHLQDMRTGLLSPNRTSSNVVGIGPEVKDDAERSISRTTKNRTRLFCKLARNDGGENDPLWTKVSMGITDEITAHTSLFLPGPHYEELVCNVGETIVEWVQSTCNEIPPQ